MSDELLRYYNAERAYFNAMAGEFEKAHPDAAANLRVNAEGTADPYVGRMIEAFAYLCARIRHKIDDDYPEIAESVMDILYPHYVRPFPSAAILQLTLDRGQADLTTGHLVARHTTVESEPIESEPCLFRTAYPVTCWPIEVKSAFLGGHPFEAPQTPNSAAAESVLAIRLSSFSSQVQLADIQAKSLRFYINSQTAFSYKIYELLLNDAIDVCLAVDSKDENPVLLKPSDLKPVGFEEDEGLLEYPPQSFIGYRLLSEFFAFPDKFLFIDLELGEKLKKFQRQQIHLYVYLRKAPKDLYPQISETTFCLGCTPIINLFEHRAESIELEHFDSEFKIVTHPRRPFAYEIYSIDRVTGVSDNEEAEFKPFYSFRHGSSRKHQRAFWHASRRQLPSGTAGDRGTDMYVSFVDLEFKTPEPGKWSIDIETICTNRDLPRRLRGNPKMKVATAGVVANVRCLTHPSPTLRPQLRQGTRWRLVSQLSLNMLSLTDDDSGLDAFHEILSLYDLKNTAASEKTIKGLVGISGRQIIGRVPDAVPAGMCRGLEVTLKFDPEEYASGVGMFLFASVLERFLGLYVQINSFVQTVAVSSEQDEVIKRWKPRAGEKTLL